MKGNMRFKIRDREYEFNGEYTLAEAMVFQDKADTGVAELQRELNRGNPYVVATMMYVLKKRAGEAVRWQDMQQYSITDLQFVPDDNTDDTPDSEEGGEVAGEAPDPTEAPGTTPEDGTASTS